MEAGEKHGHEMLILDHLKCVLIIEKGNPHVYYGGKEVAGINAIIPRIGTSVTFYGAAVVRQFEQMKVFSCVESQALVRSRDKLEVCNYWQKPELECLKLHLLRHPKISIQLLNVLAVHR